MRKTTSDAEKSVRKPAGRTVRETAVRTGPRTLRFTGCMGFTGFTGFLGFMGDASSAPDAHTARRGQSSVKGRVRAGGSGSLYGSSAWGSARPRPVRAVVDTDARGRVTMRKAA
ncbi:hypothetical protein GCM10020221_09660 [Streptomyces thioluteus]|uniref:Uncharacterized protein n=1 Tax=Streptomyces thioluteus TaxID=66431 RepID=A0ABP6J063_STRTU